MSQFGSADLAKEGYLQNVIVYRCVSLIVNQAAQLKYELFPVNGYGDKKKEILSHPLLALLKRPYATVSESQFKIQTFSDYLINGNSYTWMMPGDQNTNEIHIGQPPVFLMSLMPGSMDVQENPSNPFQPQLYRYYEGVLQKQFPVGMLGDTDLIHMRTYNPNSRLIGASPILPAGAAVDGFNAAGLHNYNLIKSGMRPSMIISVPFNIEQGEDFFEKVQTRFDEKYSSHMKTGKAMVLGGGVKAEMVSQNMVDSDFYRGKQVMAKEIAVAYHTPQELLGLDPAKYDNLNAAYGQLWGDSVYPLIDQYIDYLNLVLVPRFDKNIVLGYNVNHVDALVRKNAERMASLEKVSYLTQNEKRKEIGFEPHESESADELPPASKQSTTDPDTAAFMADQMANEGKSFSEARRLSDAIFG